MNLMQSVVLGLVQGLTEFIPVSSSGHLEIVNALFGGGVPDFHLFLEFINIGTLLALLIFYRRKIIDIVKRILKGDWRLARNVLLTSIPAGLIGLLLARVIEGSTWLGNIVSVAIAMGLIGIVMIIIDHIPSLSKVKDGTALSPWRALGIGVAQTLALIPGVSRSGSTIIAGRVMGMNSEASADYSFLASIPIMCGVMLKTFLSSSDRAYFVEHLDTMIVANVVAFIAGLIAIKFVLKFLSREGSLQKFGWYRVAVATLILIVVLV